MIDALGSACAQTDCRLYEISSQPYQEAINRTTSDLRTMQSISYFHLVESEAGNLRWDPRPLSYKSPIIVTYAGHKQVIFAVMILGDAQNVELYPTILNGSVVGLELIEDDAAVPRIEGKALADDKNGDIENESANQAEAREIYGPYMNESASSDSDPSQKFHPQPRSHLAHSAVRRTPIGIPYIPPTNHTVSPLSPTHTRSLGQALIRSIDTKAQAFHLLTPIPLSEFQELHSQNRKIVLVRGKLDTPTWAYKEEFEYERFQRREREKAMGKDTSEDQEAGEKVVDEDEETRVRASGQPWVSVIRGEGKSTGKARKIRRDIKYRSMGNDGR